MRAGIELHMCTRLSKIVKKKRHPALQLVLYLVSFTLTESHRSYCGNPILHHKDNEACGFTDCYIFAASKW